MTKKQPKIAPKNVPNAGKRPRIIEDPDSYLSKCPSWRFSRVDYDHPKWAFRINDIDVLQRLSSLETMMWKDIMIVDKKSHHHIKVEELIKEAQKRLIELDKKDVDELFSLRVNGKKRIFGILDDGNMFFLWYDKEHEICTSHKKGT